MIKTDSVSVSIYEADGKIKVFAQFGIQGLSIGKDDSGRMNENKRKELQKALEDALAGWQLGNV